MKKCPKCGFEKQDRDFYPERMRNGTYKLSSYCRPCFKERAVEYYKKKAKPAHRRYKTTEEMRQPPIHPIIRIFLYEVRPTSGILKQEIR